VRQSQERGIGHTHLLSLSFQEYVVWAINLLLTFCSLLHVKDVACIIVLSADSCLCHKHLMHIDKWILLRWDASCTPVSGC
jgi:hypothetical protein